MTLGAPVVGDLVEGISATGGNRAVGRVMEIIEPTWGEYGRRYRIDLGVNYPTGGRATAVVYDARRIEVQP